MNNQQFSSLNLPREQLDNLDSLGYSKMTPIQTEALPLAMAGKDLIAKARTGSGKTTAFGLPLLNKLNAADFGTQALVLCPTRELASQVSAEIRRLARFKQNIKVVTLCGGQSIGPQIGSLEHGAHIVVGTPGRIKDHLRKKTLHLARVNTVVLDEADRMLEMGFIDDIKTIVQETPTSRQTLLFSATYPDDIDALSSQFQRSPVAINVESGHSNEQITQAFFICGKARKMEALVQVLNAHEVQTAVVFCNTKVQVRDVTDYLCQQGISARAIHGDLEQRDRDQVLVQFRQRSCSILVATDVAARGLDIADLPAVVNFELPRNAEVYVHRIGRTGRAGKEGLALSVFSDSERYKFDQICQYIDLELAVSTTEHLGQTRKTLPPPPYTTLMIAGGRKEKVRPGDILGALTGEAGIDGKSVGKIDVMDHAAYVAIETPVAGKALGRLINGRIKGRKFKVRKL